MEGNAVTLDPDPYPVPVPVPVPQHCIKGVLRESEEAESSEAGE
jgi:hypothetical protein